MFWDIRKGKKNYIFFFFTLDRVVFFIKPYDEDTCASMILMQIVTNVCMKLGISSFLFQREKRVYFMCKY